ncbi:MAG: putative sulfate exporter family transporter, partial [Muribaculaceae bacterium]|nr:putative sulfate exporter family transporter [Muribaculaceae bacterium]
IGYSVGPQFFHAFKGNGFRQVLFAAVEALICVATVVVASKIMDYGTGEALGLFAGSQTASASLGLIVDTVAGLDIAPPEKEHIQKMVPACYAVTYVFGAIGSAWFLSMAGPRLLGGMKKVREEAKALEHTALPTPPKEDISRKKTSDSTDMIFIGFGVALGCFIGAISFNLKTIPISLSTTGGALMMGLVLGWWRTRHPKVGYIPPQVVWFLDNIGLNLFIAVIGLSAGPSFLPAIREVGASLVLVGAIATLIPMILCIFIGKWLFRFSAPETLGCVAGARCGVAAIGAIQDSLQSTVPMIGYTVCYASANFILVFSSLIVLFVV